MKISIVTISYNSNSTIEETINSVISQNYPEIEYIIVDGGSGDGTVETIQKHGDCISHWVSEPDNGIYDAMNKGISMATGEIIGFLNADDTYDNAQVINCVAEVFRDQTIDACYGDLLYVDRQNSDQVIRYWQSCRFRPGLFSSSWSPPHPTFFVRGKIYSKYGGFNLKYGLAADFELMLRFLEKNRVCSRYIPEVLVRMKTGGVTNRSLTNILIQNREIITAFKDNGIKLSLPVFVVRKAVSRIIQYLFGKNKYVHTDS